MRTLLLGSKIMTAINPCRLVALLSVGIVLSAGGFPKVDPENDELEVFLAPNDRAISCFHNPSTFYVIIKNRTLEPQRLFEFWNSWGYQNISFYFYTADGVRVVTRKDQNFTRNFLSTYEVPGGETMVFPVTFDDRWHELPNIAEGESQVKIQVVYKCDPSFEAKDAKAWTGIVASKVYEVTFWHAHASTLNGQAEEGGADQPAIAPELKPEIGSKPQPEPERRPE